MGRCSALPIERSYGFLLDTAGGLCFAATGMTTPRMRAAWLFGALLSAVAYAHPARA